MNPYSGKAFLDFFPLFFHRLFALLTGRLSYHKLASDEVQVYVLTLIALAAVLVGTLLVVKKMTMLANALSHTVLLGIVLAYLVLHAGAKGPLPISFPLLVLAALITGGLTTFLTQGIHQGMKLQEDASIGLVFSTLFALGIVLVTLYTRNAHIGLEVVMGNADALHLDDLKTALKVTLFTAFFVLILFKEWRLICFDPPLAKALGFRPQLFNYLLMLLASCVAISAFRAVGVILFLAFLVGLPLTARMFSYRLSTLLLWGGVLGFCTSLLAVATSRHFLTAFQMPLSTSGLCVCYIGLFFLLSLPCRPLLLKRFSP
jgi:manganese/zinc/iron transport system permease protein